MLLSSAKIALIGDVMLGRLVNEAYGKRAPETFWGNVWPVLTGADAVLANLECAITTHEQRWIRTPKVFHFGAAPEAVKVLKAGNIRYVSLANNHILDFEEQGLLDTISYLDRADIAHAGAGRNLKEAMEPAMLTVARGRPQQLKIGIISLTDNESAFAAGENKAGTWYTEINTKKSTLRPIKERIEALKEQQAGLVVLSVHWGPNMVQKPSTRFQEFAAAVTEMGVDLLHGHSAHLFQGVSLIGDNLVLYDTGDFIDDYAVDPVLRNDWSFVFMVEADNAGIIRLEMYPVRLGFARVDLSSGDEFDVICNRMEKLCQALGTSAKRTGYGLEIRVRPS